MKKHPCHLCDDTDVFPKYNTFTLVYKSNSFYFNVSPYTLPIFTQSPMMSPVRKYL